MLPLTARCPKVMCNYANAQRSMLHNTTKENYKKEGKEYEGNHQL